MSFCFDCFSVQRAEKVRQDSIVWRNCHNLIKSKLTKKDPCFTKCKIKQGCKRSKLSKASESGTEQIVLSEREKRERERTIHSNYGALAQKVAETTFRAQEIQGFH